MIASLWQRIRGLQRKNGDVPPLIKAARLRHDIVRIVDGRMLYDSRCKPHAYKLAEGAPPLATGYYVVLWPLGDAAPRFDPSARYFGPFPAEEDARRAFSQLMEEMIEGKSDAAVPQIEQHGTV